jgi:hypothetical protein
VNLEGLHLPCIWVTRWIKNRLKLISVFRSEFVNDWVTLKQNNWASHKRNDLCYLFYLFAAILILGYELCFWKVLNFLVPFRLLFFCYNKYECFQCWRIFPSGRWTRYKPGPPNNPSLYSRNLTGQLSQSYKTRKNIYLCFGPCFLESSLWRKRLWPQWWHIFPELKTELIS